MKTRENIITSMCMTLRHDFGLDSSPQDVIKSGMTDIERAALRRQMSQLFDNDIAPFMDFKQ